MDMMRGVANKEERKSGYTKASSGIMPPHCQRGTNSVVTGEGLSWEEVEGSVPLSCHPLTFLKNLVPNLVF